MKMTEVSGSDCGVLAVVAAAIAVGVKVLRADQPSTVAEVVPVDVEAGVL